MSDLAICKFRKVWSRMTPDVLTGTCCHYTTQTDCYCDCLQIKYSVSSSFKYNVTVHICLSSSCDITHVSFPSYFSSQYVTMEMMVDNIFWTNCRVPNRELYTDRIQVNFLDLFTNLFHKDFPSLVRIICSRFAYQFHDEITAIYSDE